MKKGCFIVIDGGDGSGTTSVSEEVVKRLGWNAIYTHEPGGTPFAQKVRELILSEEAKMTDAYTQFLLFWAARRDHIENKIKPALEKGKTIICDRFDSSTYAYQIVAQDHPELESLFWNIRDYVLEGAEPDLYILLDVPAEVGAKRRAGRNESNYFDEMKLEFHKKVNKALKDFIGDKITNGHIIDATKPLDEVVEEVFSVIQDFCGDK